MSRPVDNSLEKMACDHIRVMDLEVRVLVNNFFKIGYDLQRYSRNSPTQIGRDTAFDGSEKER